jgi:predicted flap endonuclease-1-like 5' DNA nuclease
LQRAITLAGFLVQRLRTGWNESGLWNPQALAAADAAEVEALEDEIYFRLRAIRRATLQHAGELPPDDERVLRALCDSLEMG